MTEKKSELQKAADRVRAMQVAVEQSEKNLIVCKTAYEKALVKCDEEYRNMQDTLSLLKAQQEKLSRELNGINTIAYRGLGNNPIGTNN